MGDCDELSVIILEADGFLGGEPSVCNEVFVVILEADGFLGGETGGCGKLSVVILEADGFLKEILGEARVLPTVETLANYNKLV